MKQNNEELLQLLYYIHTEILQNEQVDKILWNEKFQEWKQLINQDYDVKIIGLYGTQETICQYLGKRLQSTITLSDEAKQYQDRAMICFVKNKNSFYIAFIGLDEYFKKDYFQESIEVSLFRYLKDLCPQIILLPSQSILDGWKGLDMVANMENTSILQEYRIEEALDISLQIQPIDLKVDKKTTEFVEKFQFAQSNTRAYFNRKKNNLFIDDSKLKNIFQQLMLDKQYEQLDLSDCSLEIKDILKSIINDILEQIKKRRLIKDQTTMRTIMKNQIKKEQYIKILKLQIELLQPTKNKNNRINIIQDIYLNFSQQVKTKIDQTNQISDYLLEISLYQFQIVRDQQQKQFSIIQPMQIQEYQIKQDDFIQNPETLQFVYHFSTLKTKQNMCILQFKSSLDGYQYKWVALERDNQIKTIFTYRERKSNIIFYYDQSTSYLYFFNGQNGVNKTKLNQNSNKIMSDEQEQIEQRKEVEFEEICYLNHYECFILIDKNNKLYKWIDKNLEPLQLQEQNDSQYQKLFTVGSGYYYCLANLKKCDLFNFNNSQIKSILYQDYGIEISNKRQINLFHDQWNWYLCLINKDQSINIQIKNANSQQQIVQENQIEVKRKYSNPFLEIIKYSVHKFGPPLKFILTSQTVTQLIVDKEKYIIINQYFEFLKIRCSDNLLKVKDITQVEGQKVKFTDLIFVMITRVALQLCTIDQFILVPLIAGQYRKQPEVYNQQKKFDIVEKIDSISFGIFEDLQQIDQYKIFIVSIIGKQSQGKSYLMNRLFGTRFGVSSARCTDGIQMSLGKINNTIFIVLDCEGLFSQRRSVLEEQNLLNFLFGLSDYTLLNQDLTFIRNMNDLFNNFTISDIKGDNLYNGKLLITVRDVNQKKKDQVTEELLQNIGNIQTCGLFKEWKTVIMSHFQNIKFDEDVREIRSMLEKDSLDKGKWSNFKQVIQTMKIMLVQLQVNDYRKIEDIIYNHNKKIIKSYAIFLWTQSQQNDIEGLNFKDMDLSFQTLASFFLQEQQNYQKNNQLETFEIIQKKINEFLLQRIILVQTKLQKQYQQELQQSQGISDEITEYLNSLVQQYEYCDQKCSQCNLNCNQRIKHSQLNQQKLEKISTRKSLLEKSKIQLQKKKDQCKQINDDEYELLSADLKLLEDEKQILILYQEKSQIEQNLQKLFAIDNQQQGNYSKIQIKKKPLTKSDLLIYEEDVKTFQSNLQQQIDQKQIFLKQTQKQKDSYFKIEQYKGKIIECRQEIDNIKIELSKSCFLELDNPYEYSQQQVLELEINLNKKQHEKSFLFELIQINEIELQHLKQQFAINQQYDYNYLKDLIEQDYIPQIELELFNFKYDIDRDSKNLQVKLQQLEKYKANPTFKQGNQQKINHYIQKFQENIKENEQKQLIFNKYYSDLNEFNNSSENHEEIIDIFVKLDNKELLFKNIKLLDQISFIDVDINSLQSQLKYFDLNKSLQTNEQLINEYQKQIDQIKDETNSQSEPIIQNNEYFQDKITSIQDEITNLQLKITQYKEQFDSFKQMIELQDQLQNLNSQIEESRDIQLSGQELCDIEKQITNLNQKKNQYKEFKILSQQLKRIAYQEQIFNQIKNDINSSHNCGFITHLCEQKCQLCNENNKLCKFKAGHNEKFHLCGNQQHFCEQKCKIEDCVQICQQQYGHDETQFHNCLNHQCQQKCNYCQDDCHQNAQSDKGKNSHECDQQHHTCNIRCPECYAFCEKDYGHSGKHAVKQHRNNEKQQFEFLLENAQDGQSKIGQSNEQRIYNVGGNSQPVNCTASCLRRGRGHSHLIPCKGLNSDKCLERKNDENIIFVKHKAKHYYGYQSLYDEILCNQYWEIQNWEHPVKKKDGQLIQFCNYYCKKCEQDYKERNFCTLKAWHKDSQSYADHQFPCQEEHKFKGIDIAFVLDSTESMQKYKKIIYQSILKFQNASDKFKENEIDPILYSIVSYTDHETYYPIEECVKFVDFTNFQKVLEFLNNITFVKSSDYCEAMLDGLHKANQLKWRQKSKKFIFIIADAPPHGQNKFHNYGYTLFYKNDNFPAGCPCGLKEDIVLNKLQQKQIKLVVLKLNEELNMTISVFKKYINLQELRSVDLQQEDYIKQMENLICEQLNSNEITLAIQK